MNKFIVTGRLTGLPELKTTKDGATLCRFGLAVYRPFSKDTTDFFDCVAWERNAEFVHQHLEKGDSVTIMGVMTTRNYEYNGEKKKAYEVKVESIEAHKKITRNNLPPNPFEIDLNRKSKDADFEEIPEQPTDYGFPPF